jgi:hypothetical protein
MTWIKSSRSATLNACVELASEGNDILLRDSKNPAVCLRYSRLEIDAFLFGAKRGEFDHLLKGPAGSVSGAAEL